MTFRFKIFRISAILIHSTKNGYDHLMKSGRAARRPIEGEETPHIETFRFNIFRMSAIFVHSTTNGYRKPLRFKNI